MRSRNIKPGFFLNDKLAECNFETRLLFIGLWCYADREGRFEWIPKRIKAAIFPYDDIDIDKCLCNLMSLHVITCHDNIGYVENFNKHQKPHPHEAKSILPPKPAETLCNEMSLHVMTTSTNVRQCSADIRKEDIMIDDIRKEDTLITGTMNKEEKSQDQFNEKAYRQKTIERFLKFWQAYPKKFKQGITEQIWCDIFFSPNGEDKDHLYESIINAVENQKATWSDPKYIPTPDNWLKDRRWLDEMPKPETYEERQKRETEETIRRLGL